MQTILITGASSGLGAAMAQYWAGPETRLFLCARRLERLEQLCSAARAAGAVAEAVEMDVRNASTTRAIIEAIDRKTPIDILLANAGVSGGTGSAGKCDGNPTLPIEDEAQARAIFHTNLDGVLNSVYPVLTGMAARRAGRIGIMSSLAGYRGFPGAPAYSASKAAVRIWGEALRPALARSGITVSVICPGFVRSPMTDANDFPMPFLMETGHAAQIICRGIETGRRHIAFPWQTRLMAAMMARLPRGLADALLARAPAKGAARGIDHRG